MALSMLSFGGACCGNLSQDRDEKIASSLSAPYFSLLKARKAKRSYVLLSVSIIVTQKKKPCSASVKCFVQFAYIIPHAAALSLSVLSVS